MAKRSNIFNVLFERILTEAVIPIPRSGATSVQITPQVSAIVGLKQGKMDITDFLYAVTDGGNEQFTVTTIRANDSKTDPSKKAGDIMTMTGRLYKGELNTGIGNGQGTPQQKLRKYGNILIRASSSNGKRYPKETVRTVKAYEISKIRAGFQEYRIE